MKRLIAILMFILFLPVWTFAQTCDSNYFSLTYSSAAYTQYTRAYTTPKNETFLVGKLTYPRGWMSKITAQGNIVWNNEYNPDYEANGEHTFNNVQLSDMVPSSPSSYVSVGTVRRDWDDVINDVYTPTPVDCGLIMNTDQSGNVLWSRGIISKYSQYGVGPPMYCTNVYTLKNGDIIVYLILDKFAFQNTRSYGKIVCFTSDGNFKWQNNLNTGNFEISGIAAYMQRAITQTRNGNIIIADGVNFRDPHSITYASYTSYAMHILSLKPDDGTIVWESSYESFPEQVNLTNFKNITELPNGNLSFITQLLTSKSGRPPYTLSPVNIITTPDGQFVKAIAYHLIGDDCELIEVKTNDVTGTRTLLLTKNTDNSAVLAQIDGNGEILWCKGYGNTSLHYTPETFSIQKNAYDIFFSTTQTSLQSQILITDAEGNIECAATDVSMTADTAKWDYYANTVKTTSADLEDGFVIFPLVFKVDPLPINKTVDCQKFIPCCVDKIDTVAKTTIQICNGDSYLLPDNRNVSVAGKYDISYTTSAGCDSTVFINVRTYKKPSDLEPISDTCFENRDSLAIHLTSGFDSYHWGNITIDKPIYEIYQPGTYYVTVNNYCGIKTDTFTVYNKCDYPIYMPTAFTPNNDQLNDIFRIPPQNKNHLVMFKIYNRFGQVVFSTTEKKIGWDGTTNSAPADIGSYNYVIEMKGITGKLISQHGTFTLIR